MTSGRSAACCTRCCRERWRSRATRSPTPSPRSSTATPTGRCCPPTRREPFVDCSSAVSRRTRNSGCATSATRESRSNKIIRAPGDDVDPAVAARETNAWRRRTKLAAAVAALLAVAAAGLIWFALTRQATRWLTVASSRFTVDFPKDTGTIPTSQFDHRASPLTAAARAHAVARGPVVHPAVGCPRYEAARSDQDVPGFRAPQFSPDGTCVSFIEGNGIVANVRPVPEGAAVGRAVVKLADYDNFHGGDWAEDGWIYWTNTYPGGIVRVRDSGGPIEPVTELDVKNGERSHRFAHLLPGGDALIYTVAFAGITSYDDARIDLWDLKTRQRKTLITGGTCAVYSPSGHIVYARAGKLFAVPFDLERREVTGSPMQVVDDVMMSRNTGAAHFALSRARRPGLRTGRRRRWQSHAGMGRPLGQDRTAAAQASLVSVSADRARWPIDGGRDRRVRITTSTSTISRARSSAK